MKYLNGEIEGKIEEYDLRGKILFEGEYLNGKKWNGKRNNYSYDGKLIFEEEYLNGKRWKGKGYKKNFEIKNGIFKGIEYNNYGKVEYKGEYLNRERNGKGKNIIVVI